MKALVIEKPFQAKVLEVAYPKPRDNEVTIKVERTGICGTDIHIYEGTYLSSYPLIPGHEFSGTVHELGSNVAGYAVGDRVSSDPNIFCGHCEYCQTRRSNQCVNFAATGVTRNGSMAEFVRVPAHTLVKLPAQMTFQQGAFIEPMACVVYAMNRLQIQAGNRVILFGAGAMGQQLLQAISSSGAAELVVVDVSSPKLEMAMKFGATRTVLSKDQDALLCGQTFDIVVEATGIPSVIEKAFTYMGPAAKYLQFGVAEQDVTVPLNPFKLFNKDWTILGSMAVHYTTIPAMRWIHEGRIQVDHLVSQTLTLEQAVDFFNGPKSRDFLKTQIQL
ncbi:zinc-dependent alcohol dehydrogenase family protein [Cohnella cholangitidis]|uniref:Zinc-dependent alcohol dehydrogenase family protein n=1 Tax=Cohnella cholangitidis TaxID=2598458 RepID=A0A7G5BYN4_9BACL|nr:zinc-dependent alcohol dehydrogenase family protein [Cohnella cholangitidis]QMV42068.1 zinc-dependent alcohol dehydrogenase family protein [Cohnella cholangitidis]